MIRLMMIVFAMAGPTLAGVFVTAALVTPSLYALTGIWISAGIGFALAAPLSWVITKKIGAVASGPRPAH